MTKLWERQYDAVTGRPEPDAAYRWFTVYRKLETGSRTLETVTGIMRAEAATKKSQTATNIPPAAAPPTASAPTATRRRARLSGQIAEYSAKWHWVTRARAWDDHRDHLAVEEQIAERNKMDRRQAVERQAIATVMMLPITGLLTRVQAHQTLFSDENKIPHKLVGHVFKSSRILLRNQEADQAARERLERRIAVANDQKHRPPVANRSFTFFSPLCQCGHAHSAHDQMYRPVGPDGTPVEYGAETPCTQASCPCRAYVEAQ
jgi:hypothetical protein